VIVQLSAWLAGLAGGAAPTDSSNLRGLLRHDLARATAGIVFLILVAAMLLSLGNPLWFGPLAGFSAGVMVIDRLAARPGNRLPPELAFGLMLVGWPIGFVALGLAGATGDQYHPEVVALIALLVSGLVALVHGIRLTVVWAVVATLAVAAGAALGGSTLPKLLIVAAAVPIGAAFGNRLHKVIEDFLGSRRRILHEVARIPRSDDAFSTAAAVLEPLVRNTPLTTASVIWFTDDGRSVLLGIIGKNVPAYLAPGSALPAHRNEHLRRQAASGPWITGWTVAETDAGYSRGIADMGVNAVAYMPMTHEGRTIGLLGVALDNLAGGRVAVAEHVPILTEVADVAAAAIGPAVAKLEERSTAMQQLDDVLQHDRYWPVFQPILDLVTRRVVGYEALSRFDEPISTSRLFMQAAFLGRMRDLEIATMRAAARASTSLPDDCWLSINSSAELLAERETLGSILGSIDRAVVIELSEHEIISDYGPIAQALDQLGPRRTLAVDDAGAGFASLRHILEVRPAYVKLDLGLVQGVARDPTRRALVAGFVHFANDARFALIAEGIENRADLRTLQQLGVGLGQGFLLGRPKNMAPTGGRPLRRRVARGRPVRVSLT
jgi:EAL domain-containing protein (putative c-di-GMP-specific phosphodiesterase class I)